MPLLLSPTWSWQKMTLCEGGYWGVWGREGGGMQDVHSCPREHLIPGPLNTDNTDSLYNSTCYAHHSLSPCATPTSPSLQTGLIGWGWGKQPCNMKKKTKDHPSFSKFMDTQKLWNITFGTTVPRMWLRWS